MVRGGSKKVVFDMGPAITTGTAPIPNRKALAKLATPKGPSVSPKGILG